MGPKNQRRWVAWDSTFGLGLIIIGLSKDGQECYILLLRLVWAEWHTHTDSLLRTYTEAERPEELSLRTSGAEVSTDDTSAVAEHPAETKERGRQGRKTVWAGL